MKYEYMHTSGGSSDAKYAAVEQPPDGNWELVQMTTAGATNNILVFLWRRPLDEATEDLVVSLKQDSDLRSAMVSRVRLVEIPDPDIDPTDKATMCVHLSCVLPREGLTPLEVEERAQDFMNLPAEPLTRIYQSTIRASIKL